MLVLVLLAIHVQAFSYCRRREYGRGIGTVPSSCSRQDERNGALCYPRCQTGYHGVGPVCWLNSGAQGPGSYGRGAGKTMNCGDKQADSGLCYRKCTAGFAGVGPVCHQTCHASHSAPCGVGCTQTARQCAALSVGATTAVVGAAALSLLSFGIPLGLTAGGLTGYLAGHPFCDLLPVTLSPVSLLPVSLTPVSLSPVTLLPVNSPITLLPVNSLPVSSLPVSTINNPLPITATDNALPVNDPQLPYIQTTQNTAAQAYVPPYAQAQPQKIGQVANLESNYAQLGIIGSQNTGNQKYNAQSTISDQNYNAQTIRPYKPAQIGNKPYSAPIFNQNIQPHKTPEYQPLNPATPNLHSTITGIEPQTDPSETPCPISPDSSSNQTDNSDGVPLNSVESSNTTTQTTTISLITLATPTVVPGTPAKPPIVTVGGVTNTANSGSFELGLYGVLAILVANFQFSM